VSQIPCSVDYLKAHESQLDALKKPGVSYDLYLDAAELKLIADLKNRYRNFILSWVRDLSQLTPLKAYWTLALIYRQASLTKGDRNWEMADLYEGRYGAELNALHIEVQDGARVQTTRSVIRCS
jgi:hypothetical protein